MNKVIDLVKNKIKEIKDCNDNPVVINIKTGEGSNKIITVVCVDGYFNVKYLNYNNKNYNFNEEIKELETLIDALFDTIKENKTVDEITDNIDLTFCAYVNEPAMFVPVLSDPDVNIENPYLIDGAHNTINSGAALYAYLENTFPDLNKNEKYGPLFDDIIFGYCGGNENNHYKTVMGKYFDGVDLKNALNLIEKANNLRITGIRYQGKTYDVKNVEFLDEDEIGFYQQPIKINYEILPGITVDIISSFYRGYPT